MEVFELCEAIANHLNSLPTPPGPAGSIPYNADTTLPKAKRLEDIRDLDVRVLPASHITQTISRSSDELTAEVLVGIQQHLEGDLDEELRVRHELSRFFQKSLNRVAFGPWCYYATALDPVFVHEHLEQHSVFTCMLRLTYKTRT